MSELSVKDAARRRFLQAVPAAAALGLAVGSGKAFGAAVADDQKWPGPAANFQLFSAAAIGQDIAATEAKPGNVNLVEDKVLPFSMVLTSENRKSAPEFEWHASRDHIIEILEGWTEYEVGGTPKGGHYIGPGEWRGPDVVGPTKLTLRKGDRLVIPRGTPHRRTTPESVTLTLISPEGPSRS